MSPISTKSPSRDVLPNIRIADAPTQEPPKVAATQERSASASGTEHDVPFLGTDDSPPHFEPWLGVSLLTFVPGSLIFFLPHAILTRALIPICVAMAGCFFAGLGMLMRDRKIRRRATS